MLPRHDGEGWIELYHHLLMLRSKLTFDQLVGINIQHGELKSIIRAAGQLNASSALCSNHVMRCGKHFAVFTGNGRIGVVRPVQIKRCDFGEGELYRFSPSTSGFWEYPIGQRTDRWTDSNVHYCSLTSGGTALWCDWASRHPRMDVDGFQSDTPIGLLLNLDEGTLSVYQNAHRVATLKDGLSGEYCWYSAVCGRTTSISIERGSAPGEEQAG
mmetsp:Transcript_34819/g.78160  ORF Transcript_34819/g.78160 Transcript_34819/m.78160 type:complete len:214 (+) Transcript_34819:286-927(+)